MPVRIGSGPSNAAAAALRIGTGTTNVPIVKRMAGTGTNCVQVWPVGSDPVIEISDDFAAYTNGSELPSPWNRRTNSTSSNVIYTTAADTPTKLVERGGSLSTARNAQDHYFHSTALSSQNQWAEVELRRIPTISDNRAGVILRRTSAAGPAPTVFVCIQNSDWMIAVGSAPNTSNGHTNIVASGSGSYSSGGILRGEAEGNEVRVYWNDTLIGIYTGTLPTGSHAGICVGRNYSTTRSQLASFKAGTF